MGIVEKEKLLTIIEKLLSSGESKTVINPAYMQYFEIEELMRIVKTLEDKQGVLSEDDINWLQQFKRESCDH
jgi:hypothetical protein